ncbi:hypothetical protein VTJ04DRAFT_329 [Mycothermus thermophilus]|uniref:uncharacterized protein n=1 Tax=Humicola insolens TaxID=85995 RepID=UPI0037446CD1
MCVAQVCAYKSSWLSPDGARLRQRDGAKKLKRLKMSKFGCCWTDWDAVSAGAARMALQQGGSELRSSRRELDEWANQKLALFGPPEWNYQTWSNRAAKVLCVHLLLKAFPRPPFPLFSFLFFSLFLDPFCVPSPFSVATSKPRPYPNHTRPSHHTVHEDVVENP